jgi:hypothetical protein
MNNSKFVIDNALTDAPVADLMPQIRQRETELVAILEAIKAVKASEYWQTLQEKVFNRDLDKLTRRLRTEKDTIEMYRLQGEVTWAEKYSLENLENQCRNELTNLRNQLQ